MNVERMKFGNAMTLFEIFCFEVLTTVFGAATKIIYVMWRKLWKVGADVETGSEAVWRSLCHALSMQWCYASEIGVSLARWRQDLLAVSGSERSIVSQINSTVAWTVCCWLFSRMCGTKYYNLVPKCMLRSDRLVSHTATFAPEFVEEHCRGWL
jgi:hypothetical protein